MATGQVVGVLSLHPSRALKNTCQILIGGQLDAKAWFQFKMARNNVVVVVVVAALKLE